MIGQVEQHRVESIEIYSVGVPTGVEIGWLILGGHEAAVQPHPPTASYAQQRQRFCKPVEEPSTMFGPPESVDDLIPLGDMLTGRQPPRVVVEGREHGTTISLCHADRRRASQSLASRASVGASLLADIGHEIPTSLLPSLLTSTLGAPASALGLIEGVSDALAGVARFGGCALSDEPARRRSLAVGGYTATAVLSAAIAPATATARHASPPPQ